MNCAADFRYARMTEIRMALLKIREHRGMIRTAEGQQYLDLLYKTLDQSNESSEEPIDEILDSLFSLSSEDYTLALSFLSLTIRLLKWEDTFKVPETETDSKIVQRVKVLFDSAKKILGEHTEYYLIKANEFMSYLRAVRPSQLELEDKEGISTKYWAFLFDLFSQEKTRTQEYVQELVKIHIGSHYHDFLSRVKDEPKTIEILTLFSKDILQVIENCTDSLLTKSPNSEKESFLTEIRHIESWWNILIPLLIKAQHLPSLLKLIQPLVFEQMVFQAIRVAQIDNPISQTLSYKLSEAILEFYGKLGTNETKWEPHVRVLYGQIVLKKLSNMTETGNQPVSLLDEMMLSRFLMRIFGLGTSPMSQMYLKNDLMLGKRSVTEETITRLVLVDQKSIWLHSIHSLARESVVSLF